MVPAMAEILLRTSIHSFYIHSPKERAVHVSLQHTAAYMKKASLSSHGRHACIPVPELICLKVSETEFVYQ